MRLSGRWPGNKAIGTHIIYSESEEATASSASMLGMPMIRTWLFYLLPKWCRNYT